MSLMAVVICCQQMTSIATISSCLSLSLTLISQTGCDFLVKPVGGKHGKTIGRVHGEAWEIMALSRTSDQEIPPSPSK